MRERRSADKHGMESDRVRTMNLFDFDKGIEGKRTSSTTQALETCYSPLASVWEGEDAELLEQMLKFYPREEPQRILDATVNGGRFWRDSLRPVIGLDLDVKHRPA